MKDRHYRGCVFLLLVILTGAISCQRPHTEDGPDHASACAAFAQEFERVVQSIRHRVDAELSAAMPPRDRTFHRAWYEASAMGLSSEARQLADDTDDAAIVAFLADQVHPSVDDGWGWGKQDGYDRLSCRLALMTLAQLGNSDSIEALSRLVRQESTLALLACSFGPSEHVVPMLRRIVSGEAPPESFAYSQVIQSHAAELLVIMSDDEEAVVALRELDPSKSDMARLRRFVDLRSVIADDAERENWQAQELTYWQCTHDMPTSHMRSFSQVEQTRTAAELYFLAGVRFSPEFLRSRLPDLYAMYVAGLQQEQDLVADLQAVAVQHQRTGLDRIAQEALRMIVDPRE